jgi:hypothetical protein
MSSGHRDGVIGRGMWRAALAAGVLAAAAAPPSATLAARPSPLHAGSALAAGAAVRGTPSEVIDAKTDPQLAGQTLNAGCADLANCSWNASTPITTGYGPPSILGDALYNCSDAAYAETAVGISDERGQSTSISETLSVEVKLGFLGFEESTAGFKLFSKQAESFSTKVTSTNAVAVPPMWKGWTETEVLTAFVSGNAYITEGINKLIEVKNIDLSFPGYRDPNDTTDTPVKYIGYRTPMTAGDITSRCNAISGLGGVRLGAAPPGSFKLTLCRVVPVAGLGSVSGVESRRLLRSRCASRKVTGTPPPSISQATATLTRAGRTYAAGTDTGGRIRLTVRRPITAGRYTLTVRERRPPSRRARRRTQTEVATIVPIAIR